MSDLTGVAALPDASPTDTADATRRALVVDDNQLNSQLVAMFLRRLGWQAEVVDDGSAALACLAERSYHLVLLDLRMPQMGGEQVCRRIRQELGLTQLPVVAYTAHSMPEDKQRMLAAGFNELLIKPISFQDVRQLCHAL
ncbi:response regulator [Aquincola tertiaricarbonis]|uniref:Response regulator n=1 Tax=Aquincola tertiaricarbonis TaxID=391953 RepID=A0ABY4S1Z2_AQUTE|nr:response regulator [Aquincola tertiaricarbonis]URI05771.1 response regulator [Aquincola tertiaricarbonis]